VYFDGYKGKDLEKELQERYARFERFDLDGGHPARLAGQQPCAADAVAPDVHERPTLERGAQPRIALAREREGERRANQAQVADGEIVVVRVAEDEATTKRIYRDGSTVRLESDNDNYEPIIVHADEVQLVGRVVGVLRQL